MKTRSSVFGKWAPALLTLVLLVPVLAGCFKQDKPASEEKRVLRIAYMYGSTYQNDYMRTQYTDLFQFVNKNIEIELVPAVDWEAWRYQRRNPNEPYQEPNALEEMIKLINGPNPPDVVMVSFEELQQLIQQNMLQPLQPFIERDKFNVDDMVPTVINGLKEAGNGTLYALAPTFSSNALIYNKKIFNERGVEYPQDNMTWDQIFDLARRVTYGEGNDRVYGFSFNRYYWEDLFWSMDTYVSPLGLRIMDDNAEKMLVNSDAWEEVWSELIALKQEKILPEPPQYDDSIGIRPIYNPFEGDAFLSGKLAMTLTQYSQLQEIIQANNNAFNMDNFEPIEWDVVTVPTHPEAPGKGGSIWLDPIFGISANAQNTEDAWKFIQFINGREWAQLKSRSVNMMVAYQDLIRPMEGLDFNIAAFYSLTPVVGTMSTVNPSLDPNIRQHLWQINNIGQMKMLEVIEGNKSVRQALQEWETEGDAMLKQIRENPETPPMMEIFRGRVAQ
jgi:multiple sugar transport system substrate-binding protein